jgi:hypothetical protein
MSDRGVSTTLNYVLTLSIAALLVGGLLIAGSGFVTTQRDVVIQEEMRVIGHQVASNVEQADRLVDASDGSTTVLVNQTFPDSVARSQYDVRLDADANQLILNSTSPEESVRVNVTTNTELVDSSADGGEISVEYVDADGDTDKELVIGNA